MTAPLEQPPGRLPDFFIVGHHKSGTTALYEMLRRHPQVFMPSLKEPRWFDSDLRALVNTPPTSGLPQTFEEYLALFADARPDQRAGEASPSYLRSRTAAAAIAEVQPRARCIAIFREPASFVRSLHLQLVQEHVEQEKSLAKAVENEQIVRAGQQVRRYSDHVRYREQLERFRACFPPEQVLVLIYDDFRRDNEGTVRGVLRFLEVDETVPVAVMDANPTVAVRSLRVDRAISAMYGPRSPVARAARGAVRTITPARVRRAAIGGLRRRVVYGDPDTADPALTLELKRRYRDEVLAFGEYLGRDLAGVWGYDELG
jgi:hypothetical protein